jgi:tetratricopeptide (TPR) repeat protein
MAALYLAALHLSALLLAPPATARSPALGLTPMQAVYELHKLAEDVQAPPLRDYELASRLYRQAIALEPDNAALHYNYGIVHKSLGDHRAAIASYERALVIDPTMRQAHFNLARSLQMLSELLLGEYPSAAGRAAELERALVHFEASVTPRDAGGLKNMEEVLYQLGREEEGRARFDEYVQRRPKGAVNAHEQLGCTGAGAGTVQSYLANVVKLGAGALAALPRATVEALCLVTSPDAVLNAEHSALHPSWEPIAEEYGSQDHPTAGPFECPAALAGEHALALAEYFSTWHRIGLSYREGDPASEDFLARGR